MAARFDLVIRNGTIVDGTGREAISADIAVADGKIAAIGKISGRRRGRDRRQG